MLSFPGLGFAAKFTRNTQAAILGPLVVSLLLTGCGGGGDQAAVKQTVTTYLTALADGNGARACSQLTDTEALAVVSSISQQLPELNVSSCADAMTKVSRSLGGDGAAKLRAAKVTNVKVAGSSASATVAGGSTTARLTKVGGHWYISGGLFGG